MNCIENIGAIKFVLQEEIITSGETYNSIMTSLGLSDDEVGDVMNYVKYSWENTGNQIVRLRILL